GHSSPPATSGVGHRPGKHGVYGEHRGGCADCRRAHRGNSAKASTRRNRPSPHRVGLWNRLSLYGLVSDVIFLIWHVLRAKIRENASIIAHRSGSRNINEKRDGN